MADQQTTEQIVAPYAQPRVRRSVRLAKTALRSTRNLLAALGVVFVYLLILGYTQYQERMDAGDVACSFTHCL